jgi:hypothetical protein
MKKKPLRNMSLVKFDYDDVPEKYHKMYPFEDGESYLFLGEIVNMPGHCAVVCSQTGRTYIGYHTEDFIELTEDEV